MWIDNYQIWIQGYEFSHDLDYDKRSFLNSETVPITITERISLLPYLTELGDQNYGLREVDTENNRNVTFKQCDDINLKVSGIHEKREMQRFFEIMSEKDIQFIKWKIEIYYKGDYIFAGTCEGAQIKEAVKSYTENVSNDNRIINLQFFSFEKEFKQFFNSVTLPDISVFNAYLPLPWRYDEFNHIPANDDVSKNLWGVAIQIEELLTKLFSSNLLSIEVDNNIKQWLVAGSAQVFARSWSSWYFVKSGYYNFYASGCSYYKLLNSICNCMGWDWNLELTNNGYKMTVKENRNINTDILSIDYSKIIDYEAGAENYLKPYKNLIIPDGEITGNNGAFPMKLDSAGRLLYSLSGYAQGERCVVISFDYKEKMQYHDIYAMHGITWDQYYLGGEGYNLLINDCDNKWYLDFKENEDENYYYIRRLWVQNNTIFYETYLKLLKSETLFLDSGSDVLTSCKTICDLKTVINYTGSSLGVSNKDFMFYGNAGSMMFIPSDNYYNGDWKFKTTYRDYVKNIYLGFFDNMKKYITDGSMNRTVRANFAGIISNFKDKNIKIINSGISYFESKIFQVNEATVRHQEQETELLLVERNGDE